MRRIKVNEYENMLIIRALNQYRNELIENKEPTKAVDVLLLRVVK